MSRSHIPMHQKCKIHRFFGLEICRVHHTSLTYKFRGSITSTSGMIEIARHQPHRSLQGAAFTTHHLLHTPPKKNPPAHSCHHLTPLPSIPQLPSSPFPKTRYSFSFPFPFPFPFPTSSPPFFFLKCSIFTGLTLTLLPSGGLSTLILGPCTFKISSLA